MNWNELLLFTLKVYFRQPGQDHLHYFKLLRNALGLDWLSTIRNSNKTKANLAQCELWCE